MDRLEEIHSEVSVNNEHQALMQQTLQRWVHHLNKKTGKYAFRVSSYDNALKHAHHANEKCALQICRRILERQDQLLANGDSSASTELHAFEHVMRSGDAQVGWYRYFRAESEKNLRQATIQHIRGKAKLAKQQSLLDLVVHIKQQRERSLEVCID